MTSCGSLLLLAAAALLALIHSGSADEQKLAHCCERVNSQKITDPITGYMVQKPSGKCVPAVIFQTKKGLFCSKIHAPWVLRKITEYERAKAKAKPSSTATLLSIITSTAAPPSASPSTPLPPSSSPSTPPPPSSIPPSSSLPSASEMPTHQTSLEKDDIFTSSR